ncbi:TIGR03618 family F420-dependent PPOX class oxidoreductase [Agromyces protaetiae]|uniref:TIGR03618 family F420-dependent PPOX class oxidoreductase n=1 Tax=Agromyces protaetiae TaxID=2509455 RepID=A0A4P6FA21_9MICO|nr:TIGR03618 family F420-dependent PPOX class oxidoreductase [Agromyces protaetiae]QAY72644.1 TIGR03618 family F420-dependent PPOX class oxidoreductase [Agromyces protaetiae]
MTSIPTIPEDFRALAEGPSVATLTTIGSSGYPQTSAIWALVDREGDADVVRTSLHASRQKFKNLRRNPKATLFWIDPANTQRTLELRCDVTIEEDTGLVFLERLLAHYGLGLDAFNAPKDDRYTITFTPRRVRVHPAQA